jgi:NAD+-dependent protein deacetylase sirtuin 5
VEENHDSPICEALKDKGYILVNNPIFSEFCLLFYCHVFRKPDPNVLNERIPEALLPRCKKSSCRGLLRPDVVWFHENLNPEILRKTRNALF